MLNQLFLVMWFKFLNILPSRSLSWKIIFLAFLNGNHFSKRRNQSLRYTILDSQFYFCSYQTFNLFYFCCCQMLQFAFVDLYLNLLHHVQIFTFRLAIIKIDKKNKPTFILISSSHKIWFFQTFLLILKKTSDYLT